MADPITRIETAGAFSNIIDVVTKLINTLRKLHGLQDGNFTLLKIIAQIVASKAALRKIEEWLDIISLSWMDSSLIRCSMLVN